MKKETIKHSTKKDGEELQEYLKTMRRHSVVPAKKGKGAKYNRAKEKKGDQQFSCSTTKTLLKKVRVNTRTHRKFGSNW